MKSAHPFPDPAKSHALLDEADIGSGEKTPGERETEAMIRLIPALDSSEQDDMSGDSLQETSDTMLDVADTARKIEHDASLDRDEPNPQLDDLDPVPPKG